MPFLIGMCGLEDERRKADVEPTHSVCSRRTGGVSLAAADSVQSGGLGAVHKISDDGESTEGYSLSTVCSNRFCLLLSVALLQQNKTK